MSITCELVDLIFTFCAMIPSTKHSSFFLFYRLSPVAYNVNLFVSQQAAELELRHLEYHWLLYGPDRQWAESQLLESDNIAVVVLDTDAGGPSQGFQVVLFIKHINVDIKVS